MILQLSQESYETVHRILLMKLLTSDEEMITHNLPQAERSPGHRAAADPEEAY